MNHTEARNFVKKNPKRIEGFVRAKLGIGVIARTVKINFIRYDFESFTGQNWRYGYSIGDGKVYGHKVVKSEEGIWIDSPNLETVCAKIATDDECFVLTISDDRRAQNTQAPVLATDRIDLSGEP